MPKVGIIPLPLRMGITGPFTRDTLVERCELHASAEACALLGNRIMFLFKVLRNIYQDIQPQKCRLRAGRVNQVIEQLSSKPEALSSNPSILSKKNHSL
jgi:hypothetical protein